MGRKVLGYWRCSNCGSENPGNVKVCPHCSHPHGDEAFYVGSQDDPSRPLHYVEEGSAEYERAKKPPQWRCGYCGSMNDADVRICRGCSHPRDGEDNDYFMRNSGEGERTSINYLTHRKQVVKYNAFDDSVKPKEKWTRIPNQPLRRLGTWTLGE